MKDAYPIKANGMGGGECRLGGDRTKSQIFDHTFCEYTFADGTKMYSQGRHLKGQQLPDRPAVYNNVSEAVHGTKGEANPNGQFSDAGRVNGHQQEQHDLIEALMRGDIYNEGDYGARSTFTAILGREACYSGRELTWDDLLAKGRDYAPGIDNYTIGGTPPAVKDADGKYYAPLPGQHDPYA